MKRAKLKLTFASRIFAGYLLVFGIASWVFYDSLIEEIKPVVRQSAESALIDTANILAELVAEPVAHKSLMELNELSAFIKERKLSAVVWQNLRTEVLLNFYITDANGIVVFSSENKDVGADYSRWRDVYLTLRGQYGARSSLEDEYNPINTVMHVAAPIFYNEVLVGVLTVYNPNKTMQPFIEASRKKVLTKWLGVLFTCGVIALLLSFWLSRAVSRLANFARQVQNNETPDVPHMLGSELNSLASAIEEMRIKLEGKAYVEHYVQTLTHELKSPMAAIRGAVEMLQEDVPADMKHKFLRNIEDQNARMQRTVDQLLRLSTLENQKQAIVREPVTASSLCLAMIDIYQPKATLQEKDITFHQGADFNFVGDPELLKLAMSNVMDNALDFSYPGGSITVQLSTGVIQIIDEGAGIPDYAAEKVTQHFFSLPRPSGEPKSTGLGLVLTTEICRLHSIQFTLENRTDVPTGAVATFQFRFPSKSD